MKTIQQLLTAMSAADRDELSTALALAYPTVDESIEDMTKAVPDAELGTKLLQAFRDMRRDARDVRDTLRGRAELAERKNLALEAELAGTKAMLEAQAVFMRRELVDGREGLPIDVIAEACGVHHKREDGTRKVSIGEYHGAELGALFVGHERRRRIARELCAQNLEAELQYARGCDARRTAELQDAFDGFRAALGALRERLPEPYRPIIDNLVAVIPAAPVPHLPLAPAPTPEAPTLEAAADDAPVLEGGAIEEAPTLEAAADDAPVLEGGASEEAPILEAAADDAPVLEGGAVAPPEEQPLLEAAPAEGETAPPNP